MAENLDVFPPSNLSGDAKQWSRKIEERIRALSYTSSNLSLAINGDNRAMAGQMGTVGRQIEELGGRATHIIGAAGFSAVADTANVFGTASLDIPLPPSPEGRRAALINVSSPLDAAPGNVQYAPFITVFYNDNAVARANPAVNGTNLPPGWQPSFSVSFPAIIETTGGIVRIQLEVLNFQTGNAAMTLTATAPTVTAMYGDLLT